MDINQFMEKETGVSTVKQAGRVDSALSRLILDHPFYGVLAYKLVYQPAWWCPTFATDGAHCFFNPAFAATMSLAEIASVLMHEVYHCCAGHIPRTGGRDPGTWNIAIDHETNNVLAQAPSFKLPAGNWCLDPKYSGQAAEPIYDDLLKNCPPKPKQDGKQGGPGKTGDGPGGQGGSQTPSGQGKPGKGASQGQQKPSGGLPDGIPQPGEGASPGEIVKAPPGVNPKQQHEEWQQAVIQAAQTQQQGTIPGWAEAMVESATKPKIHWQDLLREFATEINKDRWNWSRPSRRHTDFVLPTLYSKDMGEIVVVIDTSGSTYPFWGKFLAGIAALCEEVRPSKIHVLHVDAAVASARTYEFGEKFRDTNIKGGGGTAFEPAFEWTEENAPDTQILIYLTDLYGSFPTTPPPYNTIWIVMGENKGIPPFGRHIILRDCHSE